jgi:hypothetical protein
VTLQASPENDVSAMLHRKYPTIIPPSESVSARLDSARPPKKTIAKNRKVTASPESVFSGYRYIRRARFLAIAHRSVR